MTIYYHATPARNWKSIQREGLVPKTGGGFLLPGETPSNGVFLGEDLDDIYANLDHYWDYKEGTRINRWLILKVTVPEPLPLLEDASGCLYFPGKIPPNYIHPIETINLKERGERER